MADPRRSLKNQAIRSSTWLTDSLVNRVLARALTRERSNPIGRRRSVLGSDALEETLEILSNPALMAAVRSGDEDVAQGRVERPSREELIARIAEK